MNNSLTPNCAVDNSTPITLIEQYTNIASFLISSLANSKQLFAFLRISNLLQI